MRTTANSYVGEEIGKRIQARLDELEMSQAELAKRMHCSKKLINQYVKGISVPPVDRIVEIAKAVGCSTDELLGHDYHTEGRNVALKKVMDYCRELMK